MATNSIVKNPRLARADLFLNGNQINFSDGAPSRIYQFVFKDNLSDGISDWNFSVIDTRYENFTVGKTVGGLSEVEREIIRAFANQYSDDNAVQFQFGWADAAETGELVSAASYRGFILDYNPVFKYLSTDFSIIGKGREWMDGFVEKRSPRTFTGSISNIVKQIANEHKWEATIEETADFVTNDYSDTGDPDQQSYTQIDESDMMFLFRLAKIAVSKATNYSGYVVYLRGNTLHFHIPNRSQEASRSFVWPDPTGTVISFTPHLRGPLSLAWGSGILLSKGFDNIRGEPITVTISSDGRGGTLIGDKSTITLGSQTHEPNISQITEGHHVIYNGSSTQAEVIAQSLSVWESFHRAIYYGELEIVGDPSLLSDTVIDITVILPNGALHHSSGKWWVQAVEHRITNGGYVSILTVLRDGLKTDLKIVNGPVNDKRSVSLPPGSADPSVTSSEVRHVTPITGQYQNPRDVPNTVKAYGAEKYIEDVERNPSD